jgi:ADP-ribose pyrophosphatase YjhB (NUDIX family)
MPYAEFKDIYSKVPKLSVEVIVFKEGKILLTRRAITPGIGEWHTPGGTVLKGEKLNQTVKRVAKEELGLSVDIVKFLGIIEYDKFINKYEQGISLAFLVSPKDKGKITLDRQSDKYEYFQELPKNTIRKQRDFCVEVLSMKVSEKKV